jgi:mRNA-degrading endonuclease toxin of MazEF toxin-antitoxin module
MSYDRGDVVWSQDPFKYDPTAGGPWLVLNNELHPFRSEQSLATALTTSGYGRAISIDPGDWREGGLPERSYALPWAVHSPVNRHVTDRLGRLSETLVDDIVDAMQTYLRAEPEQPER